MSQCKIFLENYNGTYTSGSDIRGRIECYFNEETTLRGIKIRLECKEHNEWTGTEEYTDYMDNNKRKTRYITLTGDNNVLYVEQMLFGSGSGTHMLGSGRHVYPFSFILPEDLPSSFTGPHGAITYKIKAIVDRPMRFDYEDEFIFTFVSPIDFNKMPKALQDPATYSDEKTVCCWCCKGGNITLDVELPKTAFLPGETMNCKVNVTNMSNTNVQDLKVKFKKRITYKVTDPNHESTEDVEDIVSIREHGVGAHGEYTYNLQLSIPEYIVVPNFTRCALFEVDYLLEVSCSMPGCTLDLEISIWDIKMGHIAWRGYDQGDVAFANINVPPVPLPTNGAYPPPYSPDSYPPGTAPYPSSSNNMGFTAPTAYPSAPPIAPPFTDKPVYPGGPPTAPNPYGANAPSDNTKTRETSELPPPSYNEVQQSSNLYPPR